MDWDIIQEHDGVTVKKFGSHGPYQDSLEKSIIGLLPRRVNKEHPMVETAIRVKTFISQFASVGDQYPSHNFRTPEWIHSTKNIWWGRYILDTQEQGLKEIGLYRATRNVQFGIPYNLYHLFSLLKMYNSEICMSFTLINKLGLAHYRIFEVSTSSKCKVPYEKYIHQRAEYVEGQTYAYIRDLLGDNVSLPYMCYLRYKKSGSWPENVGQLFVLELKP